MEALDNDTGSIAPLLNRKHRLGGEKQIGKESGKNTQARENMRLKIRPTGIQCGSSGLAGWCDKE